MSILNIAFQNTALAREEGTSEVEQALKSCNSMSEIRKKSETTEGLKESWLLSLQPVLNLLRERASRMSLKEKPFKCYDAGEADLVEMVEAEVTLIDRTISIGNYQQQNLSHAAAYKAFLENHCIERHYCFQIRRCNDEMCCNPPAVKQWPWLPDPMLDQSCQHYKPFDSLLGHETSESDRPSSKKETIAAVAEAQQGCKNTMLTAQNVRSSVLCFECGKPRCIYARTKLNARETRALKSLLQKYDYSCGSVITPDGDALQGRVFVRLQLSCGNPIEYPYYASAVGRPDICAYCSIPGAQRDRELLKKYRVVLPVCQECLTVRHRAIPHRNPIKH